MTIATKEREESHRLAFELMIQELATTRLIRRFLMQTLFHSRGRFFGRHGKNSVGENMSTKSQQYGIA
jgi:hypothetical protein